MGLSETQESISWRYFSKSIIYFQVYITFRRRKKHNKQKYQLSAYTFFSAMFLSYLGFLSNIVSSFLLFLGQRQNKKRIKVSKFYSGLMFHVL